MSISPQYWCEHARRISPAVPQHTMCNWLHWDSNRKTHWSNFAISFQNSPSWGYAERDSLERSEETTTANKFSPSRQFQQEFIPYFPTLSYAVQTYNRKWVFHLRVFLKLRIEHGKVMKQKQKFHLSSCYVWATYQRRHDQPGSQQTNLFFTQVQAEARDLPYQWDSNPFRAGGMVGDIFSSQNPQMHLYWFSGSFCLPKVQVLCL